MVALKLSRKRVKYTGRDKGHAWVWKKKKNPYTQDKSVNNKERIIPKYSRFMQHDTYNLWSKLFALWL